MNLKKRGKGERTKRRGAKFLSSFLKVVVIETSSGFIDFYSEETHKNLTGVLVRFNQ